MPTPTDRPAPVGTLASISLDCSDPAELADFYEALLDLRRIYTSPDGHVIALSDGHVALTMMWIADHRAPDWPPEELDGPVNQKQLHLDISVADLEAAVPRAVALGARVAAHQAAPAVFRVLLDPAGHPFCLTTATI